MKELQTAIDAARQAGALIREKAFVSKQIDVKSSASDLVTEVDKEAEKIIRRFITSHHPDHVILGEEGVDAGVVAAKEALTNHRVHEHLWIVDPIDGTTNFIHGFPFFCVSIAYAVKQEVVLGVIYDPIKDELFTAEKGKGAWLNGEPIQVSSERTLAESLLASGFPSGDPAGMRQVNTDGILRLSPHVRNIRAGGSAALHLAYVAAGRLTGYWELDLNAWDLAAGAILITEAGGMVTDTIGNPYEIGVRHILATNGSVHVAVKQALAEAGATGF
ncbi:inositol monophosphatase family protein [Marininema halotolerans]|uniref:Inositol-1-monophosphatase n=1 Tax=Marininema halotolerans TaxID=1155944 RepID=A0A1I6Q3B4_9BACL|nr:inositol monophosphatase family protein [Marininema halotolerans]SFS46884.1 myo-inositol-1(or 4)-monophosphatase [Marininema halotolerans]